MFTLLVTLFYGLLPPAVAPVIVPIGWLVRLSIFGNVVVFWVAVVVVFWEGITTLVVCVGYVVVVCIG